MTNYATPGMGTYGSTWQHAGYSGCGNVAGLLDSAKGRAALVCGNAEGVFDQYREAVLKYPEAVIFAANDVGMYLPKLDHWVSGHGDNFPAWKAVRWQEDHTRAVTEVVKLHSVMNEPIVDYWWDQLNPSFALSGNLAMQIAWLMGCAPIILCGCPNSPMRRFFDVQPRDSFGYGGGTRQADANIKQQLVNEMDRLPAFKAVIRSMSGWSRDYFGGIES